MACRPRMASFYSIFNLSRLRGKGRGWEVEGLSGGEGEGRGRMPGETDSVFSDCDNLTS